MPLRDVSPDPSSPKPHLCAGAVFFHCDQIIRGLYEPFVRDWHAAFGAESLLGVTVESLLDEPAAARAKILAFLGLPPSAAAAISLPSTGYRTLHAASLKAVNAQPMSDETRALAVSFYAPHNRRLSALLPSLAWPQGPTVIDAATLARAKGGGNADRRLAAGFD